MLDDSMNTVEQWRKISNTTVKKGDVVISGQRTYRVTGFGPYFLWALDLDPKDEQHNFDKKLFSWKES